MHVPTDPSRPPLRIPLPAKPHAMAASPSKVIVAMTSRLVHIYDLATLAGAATANPPPARGPTATTTPDDSCPSDSGAHAHRSPLANFV